MIAGHEEITSGDVILDNQNVSDKSPADRSTSMMFQSYALFPHLKVIDNVAFALKIAGVNKADRHARAWNFWRVFNLIQCRKGIQASYQVVSNNGWRWRGR